MNCLCHNLNLIDTLNCNSLWQKSLLLLILKQKNSIMKNTSLISIILSVLFLFFVVLFISGEGKISINEFAPVGIIFGLWCISFSILSFIKNKSEFKK